MTAVRRATSLRGGAYEDKQGLTYLAGPGAARVAFRGTQARESGRA